MNTGDVQYKSVSPGCVVDFQTLPPEQVKNRIIASDGSRSKPSAGLIIESKTTFPVGGLVFVDIKFPEHIYTYRSKGLVSWVVEKDKDIHPFKIGVLIFGMDKLNENGVSVSIAPPNPAPQANALPSQPAEGNSLDKWDSWESLLQQGSSTEQLAALESVRSKSGPESQSILGDLISLCSTDDKIEKWLTPNRKRDSSPQIANKPESIDSTSNLGTSQTLFVTPENLQPDPFFVNMDATVVLTELDIKDLDFWKLEDDGEVKTKALEGSNAIVMNIEQHQSKEQEIDVEVAVDVPFDTEGKMIEAFEHMHEMYAKRDKEAIARFALSLAMNLIECECGRVFLLAAQKHELFVSASANIKESLGFTTRPVLVGIAGSAISNGEPIRVLDPKNDPRFDESFDEIRGIKTSNLLVMPIQHQAHTVGVIELRNSPRPEGFVEGEANLLSYIAATIAEYVHTSIDGADSPYLIR